MTTPDTWMARVRAWVASFPQRDTPIDDRRESFYGLFPDDCDHLPLVHAGYTHELEAEPWIDWSLPMTSLSPPPCRRPTPGGGVSLETKP